MKGLARSELTVYIQTVGPGNAGGVPLDTPMIPALLAKEGYVRHAIGKWHAGYAVSLFLIYLIGGSMRSNLSLFRHGTTSPHRVDSSHTLATSRARLTTSLTSSP